MVMALDYHAGPWIKRETLSFYPAVGLEPNLKKRGRVYGAERRGDRHHHSSLTAVTP